jgi:hypothetical protein
MKISTLSIFLSTKPSQVEKLIALQEAFALVCNTLAPVVRDTRCWSRVALHHMMYRALREQFPLVGSQMVCNAIYSVSRTSRMIFQSEHSPFNVQYFPEKPLPLLQFLPTAPVYFDRHTLSIKPGAMSMYTLDGRIRFEVNLTPDDMYKFKNCKLHEVVLKRVNDQFVLNFSFVDQNGVHVQDSIDDVEIDEGSYLPEYVVIDQGNELSTAAKTHLLEMQSPAFIQDNNQNQTSEFGLGKKTEVQINHLKGLMNFHVQHTHAPKAIQDQQPVFSLQLNSPEASRYHKTQTVPNSGEAPQNKSQMKINNNFNQTLVNSIEQVFVTSGKVKS